MQAQAGVDKLLSGNAFDVQSAQNAVAQAQIGLAQVQAGSAGYDVAAAQAAVNQARAGLDQATANLAGATLTAPISGVVAATGATVGEQVGASTAVVTLVDTQQVRVDVAVDESGIAKLKSGQPATHHLRGAFRPARPRDGRGDLTPRHDDQRRRDLQRADRAGRAAGAGCGRARRA